VIPQRGARNVLASVLAAAASLLASPVLAQSQSGFDYNGIVHVSWWFDEYDSPQGGVSRAALRDTGANWMGLMFTWYQADASSNVVARHPDPNKDHSDARIRAAIRDARARGLRVMVKPHVDALNGQWRGDFNPSNPDAWFQSYTQFIVRYAEIAQQEGAEGFVMGTEFKTITSNHANDPRWTAVIAAVRNVYGGLLTYAANATFPADEFAGVAFWDQLDVIGLDGYFNLTNLDNPTVAQLIAAWTNNRNGENSVAAVQNLASSRGKPVIFTEIGYKSTNRTNVEPWNFGLSGARDTQEQRDCYEAAFTVWSQRTSFMKGLFWWAWAVPTPSATDTDYTPWTKPAEQVLRTWQGTAAQSFTLSASPGAVTVVQGGAGGSSTVGITRANFTAAVAFTASGQPAGVTVTLNPASTTGNSSVATFTASGTAATGTFPVTITGTGGGLTRTTTVTLTVNGTGGGGVTVTPAIVQASPWFNDQAVRLTNTVSLTALTVTVVVQRTTGITYNGMYNTVGQQIVQTNTGNTNPTTITYQWTLASGQTLGPGANRQFSAQTNGTGTAHPTSGDTWTVTYTTGGQSFTRTGSFP
jgi:glycosyl hydrolase family 113